MLRVLLEIVAIACYVGVGYALGLAVAARRAKKLDPLKWAWDLLPSYKRVYSSKEANAAWQTWVDELKRANKQRCK